MRISMLAIAISVLLLSSLSACEQSIGAGARPPASLTPTPQSSEAVLTPAPLPAAAVKEAPMSPLYTPTPSRHTASPTAGVTSAPPEGQARGASSPARIDAAYQDALTISWRPFGPEWDSDLIKYPAPTSYLVGGNGYVTHFEGPNDGQVPKNIEAYTYRSINGGIPIASYALAIWGYRVSWFQVISGTPSKYKYMGSINVPALLIRTRSQRPDGSAVDIYSEVKAGSYQVTIPPAGSRLLPATHYEVTVEPVKVVIHSPLDYQDNSTLNPPFSPIIPSDTSFVPLSVFYASGPDWYYGLSSLAFFDNLLDFFSSAKDSAASGLPPASLDIFHYTGSDKPTGSIYSDSPWQARVYWWFGQPSAAGNGKGGSVWFPVCGPKGYAAGSSQYKWGSFGFIGPRQMVVLDGRTRPEPFEVVRSSPTNGQKGISLDTDIKIEFSKPLASVSRNRIILRDSSGRSLAFSSQINNQALLIRPSQGFKVNTDYSLIVYKDAVVSSTGERLATDFAIGFSTNPEGGGGPGGPYHPQ